jgi:CheY-like chemotaxis protein
MSRGRILVVEDEAVVRQLVARTLESEGYEVVAVENGWEAWRQVQNQPCDLLVTDHLMPLMGGNKLVKLVRELYPSIPIVLISGNFLKEDTPTQYPLDVVMLVKPFHGDVLVDTVRRLLASPESGGLTA